MKKITKFRIFFNLTFSIIIFLIFFNLIEKDFVLNGNLSLASNLQEKIPMLSVLYPEHRSIAQENYYEIIAEPIYFNVRSPINFDQAEVEIEFDPGDQEVIYLGYAEDQEGWAYKTHTLYNRSLNDISWDKKSDGLNTLWQKKPKFNSLEEFITVGNSLDGVGTYDFELKENFIIHNYQAQPTENIIENCLRGEHKFYTYLKNENLDFTFKIQDINRTEGGDPLIIKIHNPQGKIIYYRFIIDDGYSSNIDPASDPRYISINLPNLKEGVYQVELLANDDIFIREIKTKQQKIVFIDRLYLCDNPEYEDGFVDLKYEATNIQTNARELSFYTPHPTGLQTVNVDQKIIPINERHKWITVKTAPQISKIYSPKNNLKISGRGIFSLEENYYFNPEIISLRSYIDSDDLQYLIARYQVPQTLEENWIKNKVYFNLNNAKIEDGNLKFIISVPDLKKEAEKLKIRHIKVNLINLENKTFSESWQKFLEKAKNNIYNLIEKI